MAGSELERRTVRPPAGAASLRKTEAVTVLPSGAESDDRVTSGRGLPTLTPSTWRRKPAAPGVTVDLDRRDVREVGCAFLSSRPRERPVERDLVEAPPGGVEEGITRLVSHEARRAPEDEDGVVPLERLDVLGADPGRHGPNVGEIPMGLAGSGFREDEAGIEAARRVESKRRRSAPHVACVVDDGRGRVVRGERSPERGRSLGEVLGDVGDEGDAVVEDGHPPCPRCPGGSRTR